MSSLPAPRKARVSRGPRPQVVCRAAAPLVIEALLPNCQGRPLSTDLPTLERFCELMAEEGFTVHLSRMAFDRIYARERCTFARRNGTRPLRAMATGLLGQYLRFGTVSVAKR